MASSDLDPDAEGKESSSASIQCPQTVVQLYFWLHVPVPGSVVISWREHSYMLVQGAEHSKHNEREG